MFFLSKARILRHERIYPHESSSYWDETTKKGMTPNLFCQSDSLCRSYVTDCDESNFGLIFKLGLLIQFHFGFFCLRAILGGGHGGCETTLSIKKKMNFWQKILFFWSANHSDAFSLASVWKNREQKIYQ